MQLQRNDLSPETIRIIENTPKAELERLLGVEQQKQTPTNKKISKWAKLVETIDNDPDFENPEFVQAWQKVKEGAQDFRKQFRFKNDVT